MKHLTLFRSHYCCCGSSSGSTRGSWQPWVRTLRDHRACQRELHDTSWSRPAQPCKPDCPCKRRSIVSDYTNIIQLRSSILSHLSKLFPLLRLTCDPLSGPAFLFNYNLHTSIILFHEIFLRRGPMGFSWSASLDGSSVVTKLEDCADAFCMIVTSYLSLTDTKLWVSSALLFLNVCWFQADVGNWLD